MSKRAWAIGRRLLRALLVCMAVYLLVFIILTIVPGDTISARLMNPDHSYTPEQIAAITHYFGLDLPWWQQLLHSITNVLHGDWGISLSSYRSVIAIVGDAFPTTLALSGLALLFGLAISVVVAVVAEFSPIAWLRKAFRSLPALGASLPVFVAGLLLLQVFAFGLGWFNLFRDTGIKALILPALTIALPISAPIAQLLIATLDGVRGSDYSKVAQSKGLRQDVLVRNHYLRPVAVPMLTLIGIISGELLAGAIIAESVFGITGIGYVVKAAVLDQDIAVLQFVVFVTAAFYVFFNAIIDVVAPLLNPAIQEGL